MSDYYIDILGFSCYVSAFPVEHFVEVKLNYVVDIDDVFLTAEIEQELNSNQDYYINKINSLV